MATLLILVIYLAYISLGIPDSLLGAAWPAMYLDLGVPLSAATCVSILCSGGTVISSLISARFIGCFGTGKVTAICTVLTAAALFGFSAAPNFLWLCLCAIPLGFGGGSIDVGLNNFVALHYGPKTMSFLHCFYGVGVSLSPYLMSLALSDDLNWHRGYRTMFFFQAAIALICICALPLWKKQKEAAAETEEAIEAPSLISQLKDRYIRMSCFVFIGSCAIESICLLWGSTFLVNAKRLTADHAAGLITFYFVGMTLGRFLSGVLASKIKAFKIMLLGQIITLIAIILIILPLPAYGSVFALFLVGLGNGPVYPNMSYLTPHVFGRNLSQAIIGTQMAFSYIGILVAPLLFGLIAEHISIWLFGPSLLVMYLLMMRGTLVYMKKLPKYEQS